MAFSGTDNSQASMRAFCSPNSRETTSDVCAALENMNVSLQHQLSTERLLAVAKQFLMNWYEEIGREADAKALLPSIKGVFETSFDEQVRVKYQQDRREANSFLLDRILDQTDLNLFKKFIRAVAVQNPSVFLEGEEGWNSNLDFQTIVGVECLYYKDMLLEQIALKHCAMQLLKSELEMDNPLLGDDWRSLASVCGFDSAELEIERISDTLGFIDYWRSSRYRPSLEDLLVGLLKVGLVALAEVLGLYFFQLPGYEVQRMVSETQVVAERERRPFSSPTSRAGDLPANSTMLHDDDRRHKAFEMIARKMVGNRAVITGALGIEEDQWTIIRQQHSKIVEACTALLDDWYRNTTEFEPLVEHLLYACDYARQRRTSGEIEKLYPEARGVRRSALSDRPRKR